MFTCWKHAESKSWLELLTRCFKSHLADEIAANFQAECIQRIHENSARDTSRQGKYARWVQERSEMGLACPFCSEVSTNIVCLRTHLEKIHADQYKTKRFHRALHSLYEPTRADERLKTTIRRIAANASLWRKEPGRDTEESPSSDPDDGEKIAVASKSKDKVQDKPSSRTAPSTTRPKPTKAVFVASSTWEPLRGDVFSPPPELAPAVRQRHLLLPQSSQTEDDDTQNKTFLECVLSKSILIWYVWLVASRLPFQVQVTAEIIMLRPFDGVLSGVQDALERIYADGQIGPDDLQEMMDCWGNDKQFVAAYESMKEAEEISDGKASQSEIDERDALRRYMRQQLAMWSILLCGWIKEIQVTWITLGDRIVHHAAEQVWRSSQGDREYRWQADATSLFQQSEASQLTIVQCLTAHYSHWRPLFIELSHFVNSSEKQIDALFDALANSYANDIAPLSIERMIKIVEVEL